MAFLKLATLITPQSARAKGDWHADSRRLVGHIKFPAQPYYKICTHIAKMDPDLARGLAAVSDRVVHICALKSRGS